MVNLPRLARFISHRLKRRLETEPDFIIGGVEPYMLRWWIIPRNRFFNIYLHRIVKSDDDRALRDHPWWSLSLNLSGVLIEHTVDQNGKEKVKLIFAGDLVLRPATMCHRLEVRKGAPCQTLFITGPRIREWGFHCPNGWRHWKEFTAPGDKGKIGRGCE